MSAAPVIYLLNGDDEFAISQFIADIEAKLGDPAAVAMNVSRLDGRSYNLDDLLSIAGSMPFLSKRRLVILSHPLARLNSPTARQNFLDQLAKIPDSTALVLAEYKLLTEERDRRKGKLHWLERWAQENPERVFLKSFAMPKGAAMARWIKDRARQFDGQISHPAADLLATLVGDDTRLADQEIQKLLAYVAYSRAVEPEDVESLTSDSSQADIFAMVDALGEQNGKQAIGLLRRLLEGQDAFSLFGMIVRQFRLLLLAREVMDGGGGEADIARDVKIHPFVAKKISDQARRFTLPLLESIYCRLLDLDEAMKNGQIESDLALDTFVAAFTSQTS